MSKNSNSGSRRCRGTLYVMAIAASISLSAASPTFAQCVAGETQKLLASDGIANDHFGRVSISGDVAIVGAWGDRDCGPSFGAAYVYRYDGMTWAEEQILLASDGDTFDWFGFSVAIEGDVAIIGAVGDDHHGFNSGSAYVFRCDGSTWIEEQKLTAPDGAEQDWFGNSVSISDDVIVIGTYKDDDAGDESGSAYVFRHDGTGWTLEQKLIASDGDTDDWFGFSVFVSGDVAMVGACLDDDCGIYSGSAYVFRFNGSTWVQEQKILASDCAARDQLGCSVSFDGDVAVVGAPDMDENGSAYVYRYDGATWVQQQRLIASTGATNDSFGVCVSVSDGVVVVGSYQDDDVTFGTGSAYVYRFNGTEWVQESILLASDGAEQDYFGAYVSISDGVAFIGAIGDDDNGYDSGSAYVFCGLSDCNANNVIDICDISDGTSEDANGNGIPDECENLCPGDLNDDGFVNVTDLLMLLGAWGTDGPGADLAEPLDIVNVSDLLAVINGWGQCP